LAEAGVPMIAVHFNENGEPTILKGTHLLVATGRKPNLKSLSLERAGVEYTADGIKVNEQLKTTNRRIYAIGDVVGGPQFTHLANYHAGIVIRNALFRLKPDASAVTIPRVVYTDPELAQIGLLRRKASASAAARSASIAGLMPTTTAPSALARPRALSRSLPGATARFSAAPSSARMPAS
jgi:pyruvate/2-oxoglutarate dehydrogenase complex dihydrolipoamide dehydrogenase (E3) component